MACHNLDGTLTYSFAEVVKTMYPFYGIRLLGGAMFLFGMLLMAYNVAKTIAGQKSVDATHPRGSRRPRLNEEEGLTMASTGFHEKIESNIGLLIVLTLITVSVGGLVEIVPLFFQKSTTEPVAGMKPYSPLRLAGRDVYIREGCYTCHSQMIRPFRAETERYGHFSVAGESVYDHPFQWGSKRTGPDLRGSAVVTRTNGTGCTSTSPAMWCPSPTCLPIRGSRRPRGWQGPAGENEGAQGPRRALHG